VMRRGEPMQVSLNVQPVLEWLYQFETIWKSLKKWDGNFIY
jgi:hypothetical protein